MSRKTPDNKGNADSRSSLKNTDAPDPANLSTREQLEGEEREIANHLKSTSATDRLALIKSICKKSNKGGRTRKVKEIEIEQAENRHDIHGSVQWFNEKKGYGFIARREGKDVFFHHSAVVGKSSIKPRGGEKLVMDVVQGKKGMQAENIRIKLKKKGVKKKAAKKSRFEYKGPRASFVSGGAPGLGKRS